MKEPDDKAAEWRVFPPAGSEKREESWPAGRSAGFSAGCRQLCPVDCYHSIKPDLSVAAVQRL